MHAYIHKSIRKVYIDVVIHQYILASARYAHRVKQVSSHHIGLLNIRFRDVSVAEWLTWLAGNCGRIGAIGSSPSKGLKPNL